MKQVLKPDETWLTLKQAAAQLNVHTATVRRWADAGDLPHIVTPGGHRRFALSAVRALLASAQPRALLPSAPEAWAAKAMTQARNAMRNAMPAQAGAHWLTSLDDATREKHRQVGRRLMALTLQYLTADASDASDASDESGESDKSSGAHLLDEAKTVGREYGQVSRTSGISLSDALQAALFFRDKLLEASLDLPETTQPRSRDQSKLLRRINALLNAVQIAIAEVYEDGFNATQTDTPAPARSKYRSARRG
jgi:excisionase family DNA binding protein